MDLNIVRLPPQSTTTCYLIFNFPNLAILVGKKMGKKM